MATLADLLRAGYVPPKESALADPIKEHFRSLPQKFEENQRAQMNLLARAYPGDTYKSMMLEGDPSAMAELAMQVPLTGMTKSALSAAERMLLAQKNAALPISEGGLGLAANNTAAQRAKAMGFETPVYHGTNAEIEAFNTQGKGKTAGAGAFLTTNPITAETYVSSSGGGNILPLLLKKDEFLTTNARGRSWADINTNDLSAKSGKNRYTPQELGLDINSATTTDELGMIANELSKKGVEIKNVKDLGPNSHVMRAKEYLLEKYGIKPDETWSNVTGKQFAEAQKAMKNFYESQKSDIYAIQDPSLIRSRFAAFDPKRAKEADILAAGLAIPMPEEKKKTRKQTIEQELKKRVE
jgi:hypothetical protein